MNKGKSNQDSMSVDVRSISEAIRWGTAQSWALNQGLGLF